MRLEAARLPVSVPLRPPPLAGREELLAEVHRLLTGGVQPRLVVLSGLGGVGKTSLAAEYAYRHLAEVGVAWQITAEDPAVLAAEMAELAAQVGGRTLADLRDPVVSAHAVLAAYPASWLLIFDNASDEESVRRFLPPVGRGRVLITSQSQHWPGRRVVDVPTLSEDQAAVFLVSRTADPDRQAATVLAGELGGLPLALEQAAAYIQATGGTLARYLALFRQRRGELLARGEAAGHPATVAATLALAVSRLEAQTPAAAGLLRLLACLAPEPVPVTLLLSDVGAATELDGDIPAPLGPLLGDPIAVGDAVAALRRFSLVTPAGDGMVLVHRLVQAVTIGQVSADMADRWRKIAAALTEAAVPDDTRLPAAWPVCAVLLPHARVVLDLTSDGMSQIARYLGSSGSYLAARDLFQLIADARREDDAYGAENRDTLAARASLASWTGLAGDAAGARDQYAALMPIQERFLGLEHPDTLATRNNLARWTGRAGDAAGARDQFAALLPVRERVLGAKHPAALATRGNLARWTGEAGDAAGARDQYAALLPIQASVMGPEHPSTLTTRGNLARWTGEAGDPVAARDLYAELLPIRERVQGAKHPDTLATRANLASWTGEAGDSAAARDMLAELLPIRETVQGAEHPSTLTTRGNLARWTGEAGDSAAARDQLAALLPIREQVQGTEHPQSLSTRANLARFTGEAGDAAGARDQIAALLAIRERVLGAEHPRTLATRNDLTYWTRKADGDAESDVD